MATVGRKNYPSRNLKQNRALGGQPSALTSWVDRERGERGREERKRHIEATITIKISKNNNNNLNDRNMINNNNSRRGHQAGPQQHRLQQP